MGDIFDLRGPEFLEFYFFLTLGGLAVAFFLRWYFRFPGGMPAPAPPLTPMEVAVLSESDKGLTHAMLAGLIYSKVLAAKPGVGRVQRVAETLGDASACENAIFKNCAATGTRPSQIRDCVKPFAQQIQGKLQKLDLVATNGIRLLTSVVPIFIMGLVILIGATKIDIGISRGRPVGFLFAFCIFDLFLTAVLFVRPAWRTRRGDLLMRAIRNSQPALRASAATKGAVLTREDVILAFALFGPSVISTLDPGLLNLYLLIKPPSQSSSSGGCSGGSGCGGGGCGGGGGGCGGCGS